MNICLNMIVKNEAANIERCLRSVKPHISCWAIGDTGSTDDTKDKITSALDGIPGVLFDLPFHNFGVARNKALGRAQTLNYDYVLLCDADMELVVENEAALVGLSLPSYSVLQRANGSSYWNTRLVRFDVNARYRGVTHEYLDVRDEPTRLTGIHFVDHMDGANRPGKTERDIRFLEEEVSRDPTDARALFYLAQSYRDAGDLASAANVYGERIKAGGWDEEVWYSRLQRARCYRDLGWESDFIEGALAAFNARPTRPEPLYDLAKFYRERGVSELSTLFADRGLRIPPSGDSLFVEEYPHRFGLKEEFSISAFYTTRRKEGFKACDELSLDLDAPVATRDLAWSNVYHYVEPLSAMAPSFKAKPINFVPPDGLHACNPSVAVHDGKLKIVVRAVNYTIDENGRYVMPGSTIETTNFLLDEGEIKLPVDFPPPASSEVLGFEDMRLFSHKGILWTISCVRQLSASGICKQVVARLDGNQLGRWFVTLAGDADRHEKNWMPVVGQHAFMKFVYSCDPVRVIDGYGLTRPGCLVVDGHNTPIFAERFRGGSQVIRFRSEWLAIVHEVLWHDGRRVYLHRFVLFDDDWNMTEISRPFYFLRKGIEFCSGLVEFNGRLVLSFGVNDAEAWTATLDPKEVWSCLTSVSLQSPART